MGHRRIRPPIRRFLNRLTYNIEKDVDDLALNFAKDLKGSEFWTPDAQIAELTACRRSRENLEGYVDALAKEWSNDGDRRVY